VIHPSTELRVVSSELGLGVFATQVIPRGTLVWALDPFDLRLRAEEVDELPTMLRDAVLRHAYVGAGELLVFCWDHARYMNHSCRPNCAELGQSFEIATRTIRPGEELTCDYGAIGSLLTLDCRCGERACRGRIDAHVRESGAPASGRVAPELLELAARVAQPLLDFADPEPDDGALVRDMRRAS
jgi:hypothetical protein